MSLYEIDHTTTQRRVEAAATGGRRALGEIARSSEDADKRFRDMLERQARAKQAMDERIARARQPAGPNPEAVPRTPPKPSTLALGGAEFREARETRKATEPPDKAKPGATSRQTLRLGAPDETETPPPPAPPPPASPRPASPRPAPPPRRPRPRPDAGDDDLSGRTWLR